MKTTDSSFDKRPTIGLLSDSLYFPYPVLVYQGVSELTSEQEVNLFHFSGSCIHMPLDFFAQKNILHELIDQERIDGLLIVSSLLGSFSGDSSVLQLCHRYASIPIVSIGLPLENIPSVMIDNRQGVFEAVSHLIKTHGCRRIAWIHGPPENSEALERYHGYQKALETHSLSVDQRLILPGNFHWDGGAAAIQTLLDEYQLRPGIDFDAVVAANDDTALAASEAMQKRGISLPEEVKIVGFDNNPEARVMVPSLTTVHQPFREMGCKGAELLLDIMQGKSVSPLVTLPAQLVMRQSCGCETNSEPTAALSPRPTTVTTSAGDKPERSSKTFNQTVMAIVGLGNDTSLWQEMLFLSSPERVPDGVIAEPKMKEAWTQIQSDISETAYKGALYWQSNRITHEIGASLISTFDVMAQMNILAERLPELGIQSGFLALYEDPQPYRYPQPAPQWARMILAFDESGKIPLPVGGIRFPSNHLIPSDIFPADKGFNFNIEALHFRDEQLGFVLFGAGLTDPALYDLLRIQISGALQGSVYLQEREQAEALLKEHRDQLQARTIELEEARKAAELANQAKSAFLANMSHELRTPLNSILGFAQTLQQQNKDPEIDKRLGMIQQSGQHLLTLISETLDLSKIEASKLILSPRPFNLNSFLEEILVIIRHAAESKNLQLIYKTEGVLPAVVQVDEIRLRQVLLNLLDNALKFTDQGEVTFYLKRLDEPPRGGQPVYESKIRFEVTDTGIGIAPEQIKRIFKPFEQVEPTRSELTGTGLGLAISEQLIQLMGSHIQVASPNTGHGSRFWFDLTLPVADISSTTGPIPHNLKGYKGKLRKVLVVDDIESNRAVLVDMLTPLGFDMIEASDGLQAIQLASTARPDLIIIDWRMPGLDGIETIKRIRKSTSQGRIPIILTSASVSGPDKGQILTVDYDEFLPKPVIWTQLIEQVAKLLSIEWLYESEQNVLDEASKSVLPPYADLEALFDLSKTGSMARIEVWASDLAAREPKYQSFADTLCDLARRFEVNRIIELIQQCLVESRENND